MKVLVNSSAPIGHLNKRSPWGLSTAGVTSGNSGTDPLHLSRGGVQYLAGQALGSTPVAMTKSTIPGSTMSQRITQHTTPKDAWNDIAEYAALHITDNSYFASWGGQPGYLLQWCERAWTVGNGGAGAEVLIWAPQVAMDRTASNEGAFQDAFARWIGIQDAANAVLPTGQKPVRIIPGAWVFHRLFRDRETGSEVTPGFYDALFDGDFHLFGKGSYIVCALNAAYLYGIDPLLLPDTLNDGPSANNPTITEAAYIKQVIRDVLMTFDRGGVDTSAWDAEEPEAPGDPGFYTARVGQTLLSDTPVQWKVDGVNSGSPATFLTLTEGMKYKTVRAGDAAGKLVLPMVPSLPSSTDQTPAVNRTLAFNASGGSLSDDGAGRVFIDWMKNARIVGTMSRPTGAALTTDGVTSIVMAEPIPTDLPQTGTLKVGTVGDIPYMSWTGSTFTIASRNFATRPQAAGVAVEVKTTLPDMATVPGLLDGNLWLTRFPNYCNNIYILHADVMSDWAGEYFTLTWEGDGVIQHNDGWGTNATIDANTKRIRIKTSANKTNHQLVITAANWGTGVSNIKIIPEKYQAIHDAGQMYRPEIIDFHNATRQIRFMSWCGPTSGYVSEWSQRKLPSAQVYGGGMGGAPLEAMLQFARECGIKEIWLCIPHLATDDYVQQFGDWLEANIEDDETVYIELSNEAWNTTFATARDYFRAMANALWGDPDRSGQAYGKRFAEIMHILGGTFTGALVRVVGTQLDGSNWGTAALTAPLWAAQDYYSASLGINLAAPHTYADALSPTSYFEGNLHNTAVVSDMRAAFAAGGQVAMDRWMFAHLLNDPNCIIERTMLHLKQHRIIADTYGLRLIAYEGGNHTVYTASGGDRPPGDANRDENLSRLFGFFRSDLYAELYLHLWRIWEQIGDGPFMQFEDVAYWSKYGAWSIRENFQHDPYPIQRLLNALSRESEPWW